MKYTEFFSTSVTGSGSLQGVPVIRILALWALLVLSPGLVAAEERARPDDGPRPAEKALAKMLRHRTNRGDVTRRYVAWTGAALLVAAGIFVGHRQLRKLKRVMPRRSLDQALEGRGFDPVERDLLESVASHSGKGAMKRLLASPRNFDVAVHQANPGLNQNPQLLRTLESVRRKLGWNDGVAVREAVPGKSSAILAREIIVPDLEIELFGKDELAGYCLRGVVVQSRDSIIVRIQDPDAEVPWGEGDPVQGYIWRENDAGYIFQTEVEQLLSGRWRALVLKQPVDLERKQRRVFVRAPYDEGHAALIIREDGSELLPGDPGWLERAHDMEVWTEDVSAGGCRILTQSALEVDDYVSFLEFEPLNGEPVLTQVMNDLGRTATGHYKYGVKYCGLSQVQRDIITRFVFAKQRASIRAGKSTQGT